MAVMDRVAELQDQFESLPDREFMSFGVIGDRHRVGHKLHHEVRDAGDQSTGRKPGDTLVGRRTVARENVRRLAPTALNVARIIGFCVSVKRSGVVDLGDIRMRQAGEDLDFKLKPPQPRGRPSPRRHDLEGDGAFGMVLLGLVDPAHPAPGDNPCDLIFAQPRADQLVGCLGLRRVVDGTRRR